VPVPPGFVSYFTLSFLAENPEIYFEGVSAAPKHEQQSRWTSVKVVPFAVSADISHKDVCSSVVIATGVCDAGQHFAYDLVCMRKPAFDWFQEPCVSIRHL